MKKYIIVLSLVVLVIIGIVLARKPSQDSTFRVGAIFILSGTGSNWGTNAQKGTDLAVEEINANGGVLGKKMEMVYEDNTGDDSHAAVSALQKLKGQGVRIVLGTNWTPSGLAVAPIACREEVLMISPSLGVKEFNETCDWLFNLWPHDDVLSEKLGHYLYEKGFRRIAVLGSLQEWEKTQAVAVKKGFEKTGGKVIAYELPAQDEKDFRLEATKIKQNYPEAVVFTNFAYEHLSAKRLREQGVTVPFFSVLMDDDRIKGAEGAFEGTVVITSLTPIQEFQDKYSKKYSVSADIGSDTAYDSVMLIKEAVEKAKSFNPKDIKDYLNKLKSNEGASGSLVFDGKGGVTKDPRFMIVKNGKLISLEE